MRSLKFKYLEWVHEGFLKGLDFRRRGESVQNGSVRGTGYEYLSLSLSDTSGKKAPQVLGKGSIFGNRPHG